LNLSDLSKFIDKISLKKLEKNGLRLGTKCFVGSNVSLDPTFCWLITIGDNCTLTDNVSIIAHDASTRRHMGYTKIGSVTIGNKCFVGVGAIILPGVHIGDNVIIGAGSVVTHDIPSNCVAVGNPAKVIDTTENYVERHMTNLNNRPIYPEESWTIRHGITEANKKIMRKAVEKKIGYIK
jgi:maltose O-acetyltransferase